MEFRRERYGSPKLEANKIGNDPCVPHVHLVQTPTFRKNVDTNYPHRNMARFLTQWYFHRVQEHLKRSSEEEVMAFLFKTGQFTLLTMEIVCDIRFQGS